MSHASAVLELSRYREGVPRFDGAELRTIRLSLGLTPERVAERVGIEPATVDEMEEATIHNRGRLLSVEVDVAKAIHAYIIERGSRVNHARAKLRRLD